MADWMILLLLVKVAFPSSICNPANLQATRKQCVSTLSKRTAIVVRCSDSFNFVTRALALTPLPARYLRGVLEVLPLVGGIKAAGAWSWKP